MYLCADSFHWDGVLNWIPASSTRPEHLFSRLPPELIMKPWLIFIKCRRVLKPRKQRIRAAMPKTLVIMSKTKEIGLYWMKMVMTINVKITNEIVIMFFIVSYLSESVSSISTLSITITSPSVQIEVPLERVSFKE